MTKSRNFLITKNNPQEDINEFQQLLQRAFTTIYTRVQLEKGKQGTVHIQACFGTKNAVHLTKVIKSLPGCHIEIAKNAMAAWNYCGKEDTRMDGPVESGLPPAAKNVKGDTKARNELILEKGVERAVEEGIIPIEKYRQIRQSVDLYKANIKKVESLSKLDNYWYVGPTGAGKSRKAHEENPRAYNKLANKWWDGYKDEEVVIIDDIGKDGGEFKNWLGNKLKNWLDHYPFMAETKGGAMLIRPKKFIITSNYMPHEIWEDDKIIEPLKRRIKVMRFYN